MTFRAPARAFVGLLTLITALALLSGCSRARKDAIALINQGVETMGRGDGQTAEALFAHAAQLDPEYSEAHYHLGLAHYYYLDEKVQALKDFQRAHELSPQDPEILFQLGRYHTVEGSPDQGLLVLDEALSIDWHHARAWFYKGEAYRELGKRSKAVEAWQESILLAPSDVRPYLSLGELYESVGADKEAEAVYEAGLPHTGRNADLLNALGVMAIRLGDADRALPLLEESLERDSSRMDAMYNLAFAYGQVGNRRKAVQQLTMFIRFADPGEHAENIRVAQALQNALMLEAPR